MPRELPGLNPRRLLALMRGAIDRCSLDLSDLAVFTEAASGAYIVTPVLAAMAGAKHVFARSEEHTSELQSRGHLVCRLLLEKKKTKTNTHNSHNKKTYI